MAKPVMSAWKALRQKCSASGGSALPLGPRHALAQGTTNCVDASAMLRPPRRSASASASNRMSRTTSALLAANAKVRPDRRVGTVEGDREKRGVFHREMSEDEGHLDEVVNGLVGRGQCLDVSLQEVEGADAEGGDQSILRSEEGVDRVSGRAGVAGHLAQRDGVDALASDGALGGVEQRFGGLVVVLPGSTHG